MNEDTHKVGYFYALRSVSEMSFFLKSSFLSNLVGLYSRTIIVTRAPGAVISIGNNVGISGATIYARKGITIGDNVCIGGNAKILDNDFHPIDAEDRLKLLNDVHGGDSDLTAAFSGVLQYSRAWPKGRMRELSH